MYQAFHAGFSFLGLVEMINIILLSLLYIAGCLFLEFEEMTIACAQVKATRSPIRIFPGASITAYTPVQGNRPAVPTTSFVVICSS
jgi:hypothetical protein